MQKVLDLLEKHVQWIVLGLGAVFVLYMIYGYVLTPPATVTIGTRELTASEVDDEIRDKVAANLNSEMERSTGLDMRIEPFDDKFLATIGNKDVEVQRFAGAFAPTVPEGSITPTPGPGPEGGEVNRDSNVKLVNLPPAKPLGAQSVSKGRSMVQMPAPPNADPNGQMAGDPNMMNPMMMDPNGQQVQPAQGLADRDWASAFFRISMKDLAQEWRNAGLVPPNVPQAAQLTLFLDVTAEREEQTGTGPDGKPTWGNRVTLKSLPTVATLPVPAAAMPPGVQLAFQQWAETHQGDILQPPFYVVGGGEPWHEPGMVVAPIGGNDPNNPNNMFGDGEMMPPPGMDDPNRKETPAEIRARLAAEREQKAAAAKARREQQMQEQQMRRQQRNPGGPGGPGGPPPGAPRFQAYDPNRPGGYRPPIGGGYDPRFGGPPGGAPPYPMPGMMGQPGAPGNPAPQAGQVPQGQFVPAPQMQDVVTWVHDDTVEPGKSYRYRIRYSMKNPVYNTNLAGPDVVKVFAIKQDEKQASAWTEPVMIATRTQFFIASVLQNRATMRVFRWQDGRLNSKDFTVYPGDTIGTRDGDIDYSTGHTVVDIRDNASVLVMNDQSALAERSFDADRRDPEFQKLQQTLTPPTARGAETPIGAAFPR
ncbi:MAG TPA: hypothetical protein VGN72_17765 [Tepidisphaeraceae bacterium]|jgi:hypothetical protein|nr:hypothetical protein [Tepidisphaeraceae bacterium]